MRFAPSTFRPAFGRVLTVVMCAIAAAGLAGFLVAADWSGLVRYGWGLLALAALAIALFWLPSISVAEHGVTVRNVFSTVHVPWPAIQRVDTKYALTLFTPLGKVTAWASPAPNRYATQLSSSSEARLAADAMGSSPRPGDLPSTPSGAVALVIRRHLDDLRDDRHLDTPVLESDALRRHIHWPVIAALGTLLLATVLGILL